MHYAAADSIDYLYQQVIDMLFNKGNDVNPRGLSCRELSPCILELRDPQKNILLNSVRNASRRFMGAEFLWILMGRKDVAWISQYSRKIIDYSDDGLTFFGAYGPKIQAQLSYLLLCLREDPLSRQGVITIWHESPRKTKDIPCTVSLQFIQRPLGQLNLIVYMRSQDAWLGLPYDIHNFASLQLFVAGLLGLSPGTFTLIQGSLHLYENAYDYFLNEQRTIFDITKGISPENKTPLGTNMAMVDLRKIINDPYHLSTLQLVDPLLRQKVGWLNDKDEK